MRGPGQRVFATPTGHLLPRGSSERVPGVKEMGTCSIHDVPQVGMRPQSGPPSLVFANFILNLCTLIISHTLLGYPSVILDVYFTPRLRMMCSKSSERNLLPFSLQDTHLV